VAEAVEGVKNLAYEGFGYEWPRLWSGCDTVKVESRPAILYPS